MKPAVRLWWVLPCICLLGGCEQKPTDGLVSANSNAVPPTGSTMVIYDDMLETEAGSAPNLFPSNNNNQQQINMSSNSNPHSGRFCIYYSWNGADLANPGSTPDPEHTFAGLDLAITNNLANLATLPALNLSAAGYTKCTFWLRGSLSSSTSLLVQAPDDGNPSTIPPSITISNISDTWQQYTISISPGDLQSVKEFFKLTFVYTQPTGTTAAGGGGTVYIDDIQYNK